MGKNMEISYHVNPKTKRTVAVAKTQGGFAQGIDPSVAEAIIAKGLCKPDDLLVPVKMKASCAPARGDEYDEQTGREIARDKVLQKFYRRVKDANASYVSALNVLTGKSLGASAFCQQKIDNAAERLDANAKRQ